MVGRHVEEGSLLFVMLYFIILKFSFDQKKVETGPGVFMFVELNKTLIY